MRKRIKVGLGVMGGLVSVVIGSLVAGLTGVVVQPAAGTRYGTVTFARLTELAHPTNEAVLGELRSGFGRVKLTPTLGAPMDAAERGEFVEMPLAGYGDRQGRPATGVHDEIWVKAVAFAVAGRTGAIASADALIIPREVADAAAARVQRETGLDRGAVYYGATHTHCGLGGWGEGFVGKAFAGSYNPGVRAWMAQQLAAAVTAALADLGPATLGLAAFDAPDLVRNRLVGERGLVDPEFSLVIVRQADGDRAVLGSYSAHATVLSGSSMQVSGDYPGFWQSAVEQSTGGLALFLAGGVGSHGPKPPESGMEGARRMGELLAQRTLAAFESVVLTNRLRFDLRTLEVELPELQVRVSDRVRLRPWVAAQLLPVRRSTLLQALRLGDGVWLSTPCDYSGELALDLKAVARESGLHAVVTSFNGDYVGYVVPEKYYALDAYETRTMSFFGPQLPGYFDQLLRGLVKVVASSPASSRP